jgi:hypothetical protein
MNEQRSTAAKPRPQPADTERHHWPKIAEQYSKHHAFHWPKKPTTVPRAAPFHWLSETAMSGDGEDSFLPAGNSH